MKKVLTFRDRAIRGLGVLALFFLIGLLPGTPVFAQKVLKGSGVLKLGVFLGTWNAESTDTAEAGKISAVSTGSWSAGGDFLVVEQVVTNDGVKANNLSIFQYNAATDDYTLTLVGIPGMAPFTVPLAYSGDTLIFHSEYMENGAKKYNRTLNIFSSPTSYRYVIQNSSDGVNWQTAGEGRATKRGSGQ